MLGKQQYEHECWCQNHIGRSTYPNHSMHPQHNQQGSYSCCTAVFQLEQDMQSLRGQLRRLWSEHPTFLSVHHKYENMRSTVPILKPRTAQDKEWWHTPATQKERGKPYHHDLWKP